MRRRIRTCSTPPSPTNIRLARPGASQHELDGGRRAGPGCCPGSPRCRGAGTPRSGPGAPPCPAASGSGSRWPGRCWPTRPLLILDEPTAHLDPDNRRALTADLLAATAQATARGRATLLITHEMDGLDQVDEIVVLDGGRVAERGTHQALLEAGGLYQEMWAAAQAPGGLTRVPRQA